MILLHCEEESGGQNQQIAKEGFESQVWGCPEFQDRLATFNGGSGRNVLRVFFPNTLKHRRSFILPQPPVTGLM